jgi:hypothetical protein
LLDWGEAMTYRQGRHGAILGATVTLLHYLLDGPPEDGKEALIGVLAGALMGCTWMIHVYLGWLNGYGRAIRWGGAVMGLFTFAASAGHDHPRLSPYLSLLAGVGLGTLVGAMAPLAIFRLKARLEPKSRLRKFALLLGYPSIRFHQDNPKSMVSDNDPVETRMLLHQYWGVLGRDDLSAVLDDLLAEDRLGQTVEVVRWAVTDAMLSKSEGWSILERVGRRAQELYGSWEDFAANDPLAQHLQTSLQQSLEEKRGVWKRHRWPVN